MSARKNPADLTKRNNDARKKDLVIAKKSFNRRVDALEDRIEGIETTLRSYFADNLKRKSRKRKN